MHHAIISAETVSILYLTVLLVTMLSGKKKLRTSWAFIACLGVAIFGVGMDLLSYVLEYAHVNVVLLTTVNTLSFIGYDFELITFAVYVWVIVSEKEKVSLGFVRFISIVCLADTAFVILGTLTGKLFYLDGWTYVTGPWYKFGGTAGFIILSSLIIFSFKKRRTVGSTPVIFTAIFFVITYTSIFITFFSGFDSYMYVCMSIIMLLVFIILQTGNIEQGQMRERIMLEMSNTDVLTKLNNRRAFENALAGAADSPSIGVIFCDVNGLKYANDNHGHAAGDALLQRFSDILREHFSSCEIFRISGDEFVVLRLDIIENEFLSDAATLKETVVAREDIASVGFTCGSGSDALELVSVAEKAMYADKKAYYERHGINGRRT